MSAFRLYHPAIPSNSLRARVSDQVACCCRQSPRKVKLSSPINPQSPASSSLERNFHVAQRSSQAKSLSYAPREVPFRKKLRSGGHVQTKCGTAVLFVAQAASRRYCCSDDKINHFLLQSSLLYQTRTIF